MLNNHHLSTLVSRIKSSCSSWRTRFFEIFSYTQPERNYIFRCSQTPSANVQVPLYTSVGKTGATIFVNRIQNSLAPIGKDFIRFNPKETVDADTKNQLDSLCRELSFRVNELKKSTNLDSVLNDAFYDLVAGTAVIFRCDTIKGPKFEKCRLDAISLGTERIQTVVRGFKMQACNIGATFPELLGATRIGSFFMNDDNRYQELDLEDVLFFNEETSLFEYYLRYQGETLLTRKYERSPYYILHWSRSSDMPFGQGVGAQALPNIKRINSYIKCSLELMPFAFPMFVTSEGALFSNDLQYKPGAIITVRGGTDNFVPINMQTQKVNFQMEIDKEELQVKQIMLDYTLPTDPRQMTAAEVYARTSRTDEQIYGNVSLLTTVIERLGLDLAADIYNAEIKDILEMEFRDFLSLVEVEIINQTSQDQQLINRINAYVSNVQFDPSAIWQGLKRSETLEALAEAYNIPSNLHNKAVEIDEMIEAQAQAQQEAENAQLQAQVGAKMMIEGSKQG